MAEQLYAISRHNFGKCYSTYEAFIRTYAPQYIDYFEMGHCPTSEKHRYELIHTARHLTGPYELAILKVVNKQRVIIMDSTVLEKVDY